MLDAERNMYSTVGVVTRVLAGKLSNRCSISGRGRRFYILQTSRSLCTGISSVLCKAAKDPSSVEVEIFISLYLAASTRTCYFYEDIFEKLKSSYTAETRSLLN